MEYKVVLSSVRDFPAWQGGKDTLDEVVERGAEDRLDELIEMVFKDGVPSDVEINDFLWYDSNFIYYKLGLYELIEE